MSRGWLVLPSRTVGEGGDAEPLFAAVPVDADVVDELLGHLKRARGLAGELRGFQRYEVESPRVLWFRESLRGRADAVGAAVETALDVAGDDGWAFARELPEELAADFEGPHVDGEVLSVIAAVGDSGGWVCWRALDHHVEDLFYETTDLCWTDLERLKGELAEGA